MALSPLDRVQPVVDKNGIALQRLQTFSEDVARLPNILGSGSPEGIVEAQKGRLYVNEIGSYSTVLYVKQYDEIGGNRSLGWVTVIGGLSLATKLIYVNQESDFPLQDATTITLETGFGYVIGNPITTAKRIICQNNTVLSSVCGFALMLTYTGTGNMFTISGNFHMSDITYSCANGTVFNYSGTGVFILDTTSGASVKNIGSFTGSGFSSVNFTNNSFFSVTGSGHSFTGTFFVLSLTKQFIQSTSAAHIAYDLDSAVFGDVELRDIELSGVAGGIGIKGAASSANISTGVVGTVESSNLSGGGMTSLSVLTTSDIRWDFQSVAGLDDTIEDALIYFRDNTTYTVITASSSDSTNAVKVGGTWLLSRVSKFSHTSAGKVTYLGERPVTVPIDVMLSLIAESGASIRVNAYIYKNGSVLLNTRMGVDISGTTSKPITLPWQMTFNQNDYIEVFVENTINTKDILVDQATIRIR